MRARVPRVTVAAGCGGSGRELARFGDLDALDAFLLGPIAGPSDDPSDDPGGDNSDDNTENAEYQYHDGPPTPGRLTLTPSGLVHASASTLPADHVVTALLPWFNARSLPVVCAVRGSTVGALAQTLQVLRASLDFGTVVGVEVDLTAARAQTRPSVGGVSDVDNAAWSADPQACLKLLSAAREQLPRDLLLLAKFGGECPDPVATARSAVGGGARALVLSGSVPALQAGHHLVGPAVAPISLGLLDRIREAVEASRVPDVPLVLVGGLRDPASARAATAAGAEGVQLGSGILADPELLWRVHDALSQGEHDEPDEPDESGAHHVR